jgi:uncharacterized lipoprotein YehR (DUF1307 family)
MLKLERSTFTKKEVNNKVIAAGDFITIDVIKEITELIVCEFRDLEIDGEFVYNVTGCNQVIDILPCDKSDNITYQIIYTGNTVELICLYKGYKLYSMSSDTGFLLISYDTENDDYDQSTVEAVDWMMFIKDILEENISFKTMKALESVRR